MYTAVQRVYQNAVSIRVFRFIWFTAMRVIDIMLLLYEVLRDLPICVQRLCGHPYGKVSQQAVQIPTAVVPKCRLRQSSPLGLVYCHAHYLNCTATVRGATGSPNFCTKVAWAYVQQCKAANCTDPYNGCTKMPFASEFSPLGGVLPCAFSELYTYCTRCHDTAQFVYKDCGT